MASFGTGKCFENRAAWQCYIHSLNRKLTDKRRAQWLASFYEVVMEENIISLSAQYPLDQVETLIELADADFNPTFFHDLETRKCTVSFFIEDKALLDEAKNSIENLMTLLGNKRELEVENVKKEDWSESWKRFFHVEHISEHIVIRPSWELYDAAPGEKVLIIDPGINFGTGKHPTTQACLKFLDKLAGEDTKRTVMDMGCGTGILGIGAKLLGFNDVQAFDIDPDCIQGTKENAKINGVEIPVCEGSIANVWPTKDIVVANILAPVLIEYAASVYESVAPNGVLILSGILDTQYESVKSAYEKLGAVEMETMLIGEWRSGLFRKPA